MESEHQEQKAFVKWFRATYKDYIIFAVPNGGSRNKFEAKRLKEEGLVSGVCDLIILMPNAKTLFVEFKRKKGGTISKTQKEFMNKLEIMNFDYFIAYGCVDGVDKFKQYLISKGI